MKTTVFSVQNIAKKALFSGNGGTVDDTASRVGLSRQFEGDLTVGTPGGVTACCATAEQENDKI